MISIMFLFCFCKKGLANVAQNLLETNAAYGVSLYETKIHLQKSKQNHVNPIYIKEKNGSYRNRQLYLVSKEISDVINPIQNHGWSKTKTEESISNLDNVGVVF